MNSIRNRGENSNPKPAKIRFDGGVAAARNVPASQGATGNDSRAKAEESPLETWVRQHPPIDGTQLLVDYLLEHDTTLPRQTQTHQPTDGELAFLAWQEKNGALNGPDTAAAGQTGAAQQAREQNAAATGDAQYSIRYDAENTPFVVVEQDILQGVPQNEWVKTVKDNLRKKFPHGVHVGNNLVVINNQSRREMTFSNYMQRIIKTEPNLYKDKLRATYYADEILQASRNYVNEALLHPRKDTMIDFARGEVLLRIGTKDYKAQVIVGNRGNGNLLLYDIINLVPTEIQERIKKTGTGRYTTKSPTETGSSQPAPAVNSIRNSQENSNAKFSMRSDTGSNQEILEDYAQQHPPIDGTQLLVDYLLEHDTTPPRQTQPHQPTDGEWAFLAWLEKNGALNGPDAGAAGQTGAAAENAEAADARDSGVTTQDERDILDAKDQPAADVEQESGKDKQESAEKLPPFINGPYIKNGKPNGRPSLSGSAKLQFEQEVYNNCVDSDGVLRDPNTGEVICWKFGERRKGIVDFGHNQGNSYHEMFQKYRNREITLDELKEFQFNPRHYRLEMPSSNRSHKYE